MKRVYTRGNSRIYAIVVELVYTLDLKSNALTEIVSSSLTDSIYSMLGHAESDIL